MLKARGYYRFIYVSLNSYGRSIYIQHDCAGDAYVLLRLRSQMLHGSASIVVRTGHLVNGTRPKWASYIDPKLQIRNLSPMTIKFITVDYVQGDTSMENTHQNPIKGPGLQGSKIIGFPGSFISFYLVRFLSPRPSSKNGSADIDNL
jgi:hypothetical protein